MKGKKEPKGKNSENGAATEGSVEITTKEELKAFLLNIRDRMREEAAAPIFALSALNHIMNLPNVAGLLDNENKELSRDIWLRLKQAGLHLKNPPLLFTEDEEATSAA